MSRRQHGRWLPGPVLAQERVHADPAKRQCAQAPLSLAEQAALQGLNETRETGTTLVPNGQKTQTKKRFGKTKAGSPKPSVIKPEPGDHRGSPGVAERPFESRDCGVRFAEWIIPEEARPGRRAPPPAARWLGSAAGAGAHKNKTPHFCEVLSVFSAIASPSSPGTALRELRGHR